MMAGCDNDCGGAIPERENSSLHGALNYAARGWFVFPVGDKIPLIPGWESKATTDPEQIRKWHEEEFLWCNFGFAAGRAGIAVIDLDVHKKQKDGSFVDGRDSLAKLEEECGGKLPETFTVRTPSGGIHLYFRAENVGSVNGFLPAVDVKSCTGLVVVPGSESEKGIYTIEKDIPVADMPDWFLDVYGHRKGQETGAPQMMYNAHITPDTPDKIDAAVSIIENWEYAEEGERNQQLFQLARELCKAGVSEEMALELYREHGVEHIDLDPDAREVSATIHSAYGNLSDLGEESREGRELSTRLFDDLPPLEGEKKQDAPFGADWAELAAQEIPPRRWFIENWLSADEGYTVLFSGRGGTGKSALMLDLMYSLATGEPWCGMEVRRGARCMYVGCEDSEEEMARRVQKRSALGGAVPSGVLRLVSRLGRNNLICSSDRNGKLKKEPFFDELLMRAKEFFGVEGGVLILDTASDIFAGNEIDRSQVSQFVKGLLNRMGRELGVTIVLLAHPSKKASADGQGYSGSTAWEGAFRCRWELNYRNPAKVDGLLELVLAKSNAVKAGQKVVLENANGMFLPVDEARADEKTKEVLVDLIANAYESGEPYGRTARSPRPIVNVKICDPVTSLPLSREEIGELVEELIAEGKIKDVCERIAGKVKRFLRL